MLCHVSRCYTDSGYKLLLYQVTFRCQLHGASGLWEWGCCTWRSCVNDSIDFKTAQNGISSATVDLVCLKSLLNWRALWKQFLFTTSADAERGFSTMNVICSSLWNPLGVQRVSNLLFISLVGPSLEDFNALPYVKKWLASRHRGAFETQSRQCHPPHESRYSHMRKISFQIKY